MARHAKIFSGSSGLNTKVDPVRLKYDYRTGIAELAATVNVTVDDSGRIERRDGVTATDRTEPWKNLFGCGAYGIGTKGDALCIIESNMDYTAIRNITPYARMSYVRDTDGKQDVIFYCNGYETGKIIGKISQSWVAGTYVGSETHKLFQDPPLGHLLCVRNGRMFIAQDNILFYSEPGNLSSFRLAANYFGFSSRLKMVESVAGGLWVSDEESIYFLGGIIAPSMQEMPIQVQKAAYSAIEGTAIKVPGSRIGSGEMQGEAIVFATTEGICVGSGDGALLTLTERKIDMPSALSGSSFYKNGHYLCTLD